MAWKNQELFKAIKSPTGKWKHPYVEKVNPVDFLENFIEIRHRTHTGKIEYYDHTQGSTTQGSWVESHALQNQSAQTVTWESVNVTLEEDPDTGKIIIDIDAHEEGQQNKPGSHPSFDGLLPAFQAPASSLGFGRRIKEIDDVDSRIDTIEHGDGVFEGMDGGYF